MIPFLIIFVIFLFLSVYMVVSFVSNFFWVVFNLAILWVIFVRSYFEVRHRKIFRPYVASVIITTLIFLTWPDSFDGLYILWWVIYLMVVFIFAQISKGLVYFYNSKYFPEKIRNKNKELFEIHPVTMKDHHQQLSYLLSWSY